jgi:hypothetical protein
MVCFAPSPFADPASLRSVAVLELAPMEARSASPLTSTR